MTSVQTIPSRIHDTLTTGSTHTEHDVLAKLPVPETTESAVWA